MPLYRRSKDTTARARDLRSSVSKSEALLWLHLRGSKLGAKFRRQHPIGPYFADYYCGACRLVVEVDGPDHDLAHDRRRDAFMEKQGLTVMRFGSQTVAHELSGVVDEIWRMVQARLAGGPPPASP